MLDASGGGYRVEEEAHRVGRAVVWRPAAARDELVLCRWAGREQARPQGEPVHLAVVLPAGQGPVEVELAGRPGRGEEAPPGVVQAVLPTLLAAAGETAVRALAAASADPEAADGPV